MRFRGGIQARAHRVVVRYLEVLTGTRSEHWQPSTRFARFPFEQISPHAVGADLEAIDVDVAVGRIRGMADTETM